MCSDHYTDHELKDIIILVSIGCNFKVVLRGRKITSIYKSIKSYKLWFE